MRKIVDLSDECSDCAIQDSLSTIKEAYVQLHLLNGTSTTAALLASQIELYDVLLDEISDLHTSLARDLKYTQVSCRARLNA